MPELPEVETIVRELLEHSLVGLKIQHAEVFWERSLGSQPMDVFCELIKNQSIQGIARRGKFIQFSLSTGMTLLVHLRMTGKFLITKEDTPPKSHERIRLYLSDGRILRYEDQRKFGKWHLTSNPEKWLDHIGIEPLSPLFTLHAFNQILKKRKCKIKPFLLDQRFIAGLGNIYADEALWLAKIHPTRLISTLTAKEITALHQGIITALSEGVANIGTSLGSTRANYFSVSGRRGTNQYKLNVFRREGLPCSRCKTIIQKMFIAQRGTHFCPHCQI